MHAVLRSRVNGIATALLAGALAAAAGAQQLAGHVYDERRIGEAESGFTGDLDAGDLFGLATADIGDFDGDGVRDLAVGAILDDDGGSNRGAVWLLFMNTDGTVKSHAKISSTAGGFTGQIDDLDLFGWSIVRLDDLDGNGVDEIAVGAWEDDAVDEFQTGAVWLLFMNADGTVLGHTKIAEGLAGFTGELDGGDRFGTSLTNVGDLDGDGLQDLAVGALYDDDDVNPHEEGEDHYRGNQGALWILFLDADGTVRAQQKISDSEGGLEADLVSGDRFGYAVASLGDLDGDGVVDLAVSAIHDDGGLGDEGAVYILFLDTDGTVKAHQKIGSQDGGFTGALIASANFGRGIANVGDLDGDGVVDIAVGAPGGEGGGSTWILFLEPDGTVAGHCEITTGHGGLGAELDVYDIFGMSAASLGDLDGDGLVELAVGAPGDDDGGEDRGVVYLLELADGRWADLGNGLAGTLGTPLLGGEGMLLGGDPVALRLSGARPDAPAWMFLGLGLLELPFKGGVLVPDATPPGFVAPLATDALGELTLATSWPVGLPPGIELYVQHWIADALGPAGFAASNGLRITAP